MPGSMRGYHFLFVRFCPFFIQENLWRSSWRFTFKRRRIQCSTKCFNKKTASFAAVLTVLSYMATAVISASEAMHYLHTIFSGLNIMIATVVILLAFTGLAIIGIG